MSAICLRSWPVRAAAEPAQLSAFISRLSVRINGRVNNTFGAQLRSPTIDYFLGLGTAHPGSRSNRIVFGTSTSPDICPHFSVSYRRTVSFRRLRMIVEWTFIGQWLSEESKQPWRIVSLQQADRNLCSAQLSELMNIIIICITCFFCKTPQLFIIFMRTIECWTSTLNFHHALA